MNRYKKCQASYDTELKPLELSPVQASQRGRKRRDAIQDEGKSKAHRTSETSMNDDRESYRYYIGLISIQPTPSNASCAEARHLEIMFHHQQAPIQLYYQMIRTYNKGGILRNACVQPTTPSSERPKNDQTKTSVPSIIQPVQTSECVVTAEQSSAKYLEVCSEKNQHDSGEERNPGTSLNTGPSVADDTTQQSNRDVQRKQTVQTGFSEEEKEQSSPQPKFSSKICSEKRPLLKELPDEETFTESNGKKLKTSDNSLVPKFRNKSNLGLKILKLSFILENMSGFWKDPETVDQQEDQNFILMADKPFNLHTSWAGHGAECIKTIAQKSKEVIDINISTPRAPIEIVDFIHYASIVHVLTDDSLSKKHRTDIFFKVGRFIVKLQSSDLYCCPVSQDGEEIHLPPKQLCYAKAKTSKCLRKKCSEILWNYMVGNHDKVYSDVTSPQDAFIVCAVLFSEVIRYTDMFFHNILMMQFCKTWDDFCNYHPMTKGGTWKHQGGSRDTSQKENLQQGRNVPEKVKISEKKNVDNFVREIMRDKKMRCGPFQLKILTRVVEEDVTGFS